MACALAPSGGSRLVLRAQNLTGSSGAAGLIFLLLAATGFLAPTVGLLVDRFPRRRVLILNDTLTGAVVALLLFAHGKDGLWLIYLVTGLYGVSGQIYRAARGGLLHSMLPDGMLGEANGLLSSLSQGLKIAGLTFLLVKPEAIAGRRVEPILEFVRSAGFLVVGTWPVRVGRHEVRNLWRYSLNELPIAHIRALEMLVTAGQLFLVGLSLGRDACRDRVDPGQLTAAELLSRGKGSTSRPEAPGTLRQRLGCPALTLNFVHAPDEPADVLRELAVLGDANLQEQVIDRLLAAGEWPPERFDAMGSEAAAKMTSQYAHCPAHDLDVEATFSRMRRCLRDSPPPALGPAVRCAIETGAVSPERALEVVRSLELAAELPMWDRVVTAANLVDDLRTGRRALVEL